MKVKRPRGATLMQSIQKAKENSVTPSRQDERSDVETVKRLRCKFHVEGHLSYEETQEFDVALLRVLDWASRREAGPRISLEVLQHDWIPGFAAFHDDGEINQSAKAHIVLNLGALLTAVKAGDLPASDLPYIVAECLMHEAMHALEAWAGVEFSEERVEALLEAYWQKYGGGKSHWQYDPEHPNDRNYAADPGLTEISAEAAKVARIIDEEVHTRMEEAGFRHNPGLNNVREVIGRLVQLAIDRTLASDMFAEHGEFSRVEFEAWKKRALEAEEVLASRREAGPARERAEKAAREIWNYDLQPVIHSDEVWIRRVADIIERALAQPPTSPAWVDVRERLLSEAFFVLKALDRSVKWELAPEIMGEIGRLCREFEALLFPPTPTEGK